MSVVGGETMGFGIHSVVHKRWLINGDTELDDALYVEH